jgi:lipoprotein signal peptidase
MRMSDYAGSQSKRNRLFLLMVLVCLLVVVDQVTKAIVRETLTPGGSIPLIGDVVRITFVQNFEGFSWWVPTLPPWVELAFRVVLIFIVLAAFPVYVFYTQTRRQSIWADVAVVGITASVLGHLTDDLFVPYATDFFQVFHSPSANLADVYSYVGIGALAVEMALTFRVRRTPSRNPSIPCTWQPLSGCKDCPIEGRLMCRFDPRDLVSFLMNALPFGVTSVAGMISAGYGWYLLPWLAYSLFFFFVWEARILCSHCPMWAEEGHILHCHANHGVVKIWKYRPGPMSRLEQVQFAAGALLWIGFPFTFLLLGQKYLLLLIGLATVASVIFGLRKTACGRCINFSCPMNTVPKRSVDAYLERNPDIRAAWEASGYCLGE